MKRLQLLFATLVWVMAVNAQETKTTTTAPLQPTAPPLTAAPVDSITEVVSDLQSYYESFSAWEMYDRFHREDALFLPTIDTHGQVMRHYAMPYYWGSWQPWTLHQGLNVSLGASVFAMFGKHAPHGAGFGQNAAMMYAIPLTDRLSLAIGGYFSNLSWAHQSYQNAGISAVLGYRFDEHWEGFLYGQKSIVNSKPYPLPLYDLGYGGDRIGAGIRYHFSPSFWMEVSVEASHHDAPYNMPNPIERFEYKRK